MVDRAKVFGSEATVYDAVRPRYPAALIDLIVEGSPRVAVDAGCGTGIASAQVAERGVRVVGVEPDPRMADVARRRGIDVTISPFEEWSGEPCGVVYAAQSWHWIDPDRGAEVAARSILPGGQWIAFWNHEMHPAIDDVVCSVYERLAPSLVQERSAVYVGSDRFSSQIESGLAATDRFGPMTIERIDWVDRMNGRHFVDRLGSHSAHRLLDENDRRRVRNALLEILGEHTQLEVSYVTEVFVATRCP